MRLDLWIAFAWGLAEATCFFIVPDVFLTFVALRRLRVSVLGAFAALAGALIGGAVMVSLGANAPDSTRAFLDWIPGIQQSTVTEVGDELDRHGLLAVLLGPMRGVPYKIYAAEWGARHGSLAVFLLVSVAARLVRFVLAPIVASLIATHVLRQRPKAALVAWAAFWLAFYVFYFSAWAGERRPVA